MKVQDLQDWVANDWKTNSNAIPTPEQQILFILEELGEVAEALRKSHGNKARIAKTTDLGAEIADVFVSLITLANTYKINVTAELERFQERLQERHNQGL